MSLSSAAYCVFELSNSVQTAFDILSQEILVALEQGEAVYCLGQENPSANTSAPWVAIEDTFPNLGLENKTISYHASDSLEQVLDLYGKLAINVVCLDKQSKKNYHQIGSDLQVQPIAKVMELVCKKDMV
ncbi:hypothetical protein DSO57_1003498 [Entomophthora muscae]|uniref:Uncharacterized protein n=1 Tax=Entomophthora muscae TaxID=34485 RepID=A0ACC2RNB0_9FUNG|nr:hypothetical protein DSO57_1003498 [Entomophthora muscae]